jgi:hypothetical protein
MFTSTLQKRTAERTDREPTDRAIRLDAIRSNQ